MLKCCLSPLNALCDCMVALKQAALVVAKSRLNNMLWANLAYC